MLSPLLAAAAALHPFADLAVTGTLGFLASDVLRALAGSRILGLVGRLVKCRPALANDEGELAVDGVGHELAVDLQPRPPVVVKGKPGSKRVLGTHVDTDQDQSCLVEVVALLLVLGELTESHLDDLVVVPVEGSTMSSLPSRRRTLLLSQLSNGGHWCSSRSLWSLLTRLTLAGVGGLASLAPQTPL